MANKIVAEDINFGVNLNTIGYPVSFSYLSINPVAMANSYLTDRIIYLGFRSLSATHYFELESTNSRIQESQTTLDFLRILANELCSILAKYPTNSPA